MFRYVDLEEIYLEEQHKVLEEVRQEAVKYDPISQRLELISFISRSGGRGVKRRPREVEMLMVDGRYALPIVRGEIRTNKRHYWATAPDVLAEEILGSGATVSELLEEVRIRANWK